MSSLTAAETFKQGHRLFSVFLMLHGSSAHLINDRPSGISQMLLRYPFVDSVSDCSVISWGMSGAAELVFLQADTVHFVVRSAC